MSNGPKPTMAEQFERLHAAAVQRNEQALRELTSTGFLGNRAMAYVLQQWRQIDPGCTNAGLMRDIPDGVFAALEDCGISLSGCRTRAEIQALLMALLSEGRRALEGNT